MLEWLHRFGLPEVAAEHGAELDVMLAWVHWLMLILFVGWGAFYIYTLVRFRAKKNPSANYKGVTSHLSSYLEVAVAVFEVVLIVGFAIPLWAARVNEFPSEKQAVVVRVIAEQFKWNAHYPGPDGIFGKTAPEFINSQSNPVGLDKNDPNGKDDFTLRELHLPVGKPALIYLSSKDVIHSFGIPEMRVKQDAIPGLEIPMWFTPSVTTAKMREMKVARWKSEGREGEPKFKTYEIACAQLCGVGHSTMRGFVYVDSEQEFKEWLGAQTPTLSGDDFW